MGCGKHKQCVWLPMPHFKEAWCSGVDFVYSIDYEGMLDRGEIDRDRDVFSMAASDVSMATSPGASAASLIQLDGVERPIQELVLRLLGG